MNYKSIVFKLIKEKYLQKYNNKNTIISKRIIDEIEIIEKYDFFKQIYEMYLFSQYLKENNIPYIFSSAIDTFFISYLLEIIPVNPLKPHIYNKDKKEVKFLDIDVYCGKDFRVENNYNIITDGFNIPINSRVKQFKSLSSYFSIQEFSDVIKDYISHLSQNYEIELRNLNDEKDIEFLVTDNNEEIFIIAENNYIYGHYLVKESYYETIKELSKKFNINNNIEYKDYLLTREDLYLYLIKEQLEQEKALEISEIVRKGKLNKFTSKKEELNYIKEIYNNEEVINEFTNICYLNSKSYLCQIAMMNKNR